MGPALKPQFFDSTCCDLQPNTNLSPHLVHLKICKMKIGLNSDIKLFIYMPKGTLSAEKRGCSHSSLGQCVPRSQSVDFILPQSPRAGCRVSSPAAPSVTRWPFVFRHLPSSLHNCKGVYFLVGRRGQHTGKRG